MTQPTSSSTLENLSRLASKPGVQSTLILSKIDGSVIRSTGALATSTPGIASQSEIQDDSAITGSTDGGSNGHVEDMSREGDYGNRMAQSSKSAEDVARMVFSFVSGAGELVNDLDKGDEVKLLRLRTRKNEMVIVPDSKFLLVVIHDTPSA